MSGPDGTLTMVDPTATAAPPSTKQSATVKFLCSYGGKIVPRHPDGKLRYLGGHTRVLSVPRSVSFSDLMEKMRDLCGTSSVSVRCQLPTEDLDALVSIKSDDDLANLFEEYDLAAPSSSSSSTSSSSLSLKIRAFLFIPRSSDSPKSLSPTGSTYSKPPRSPAVVLGHRCVHQAPMMMMPVASVAPIWYQ